jgi:MFS family permease
MHISYVWIVVAALVQWLLGMLWYGVIFKKSWKKLVGLPEGQKPTNAIFALAVALVACLLLSFVLAHVVEMAGASLFTKGFMLGVVCWLGFMAPPLFAQHIFEGRRANLFAINAAYWLLAMALGGAILAAFH